MSLYKRNYIIYFYSYFAATLILIYVNVYLPVYFFNILEVNRSELAFILIFSYSGLFLRPIIAIYFDKPNSKSKRKSIIILSNIGAILCLGVTIELIAVLKLIKISGAFSLILSIMAPIRSNSWVGFPFSGCRACM